MAVSKKLTGAPATVYLPLALAWFLSITLILFGSAPVLDRLVGKGTAKELARQDAHKTPILLGLRDELQDGDFFIENRLDIAPMHYAWLHILPAIIWCLAIPLQNDDRVRQNRPAFHRQLGYLTATCSLMLVVSGLAFPIRKELFGTNVSYSHSNILHLHRLRLKGVTVALWPTFDLALLFLAPIQAYTLFRAVNAAMGKRYAEHRTWAVYHSIAGYAIAMQRVGIMIMFAIGAALFAVPDAVKKSWGIPLSGREAWSAELAGFAGTAWISAGLPMIFWMMWTPRHGKAVYDQRGKRKSA